MKSLPAGYRVVGAVSALYGMVTGVFCFTTLFVEQTPPRPNPQNNPPNILDAYGWILAIAFVVTGIALVFGGCSLFIRRLAALRAALVLLLVGVLGLLSEAVIIAIATYQLIEHPGSSTGGLAALITVPMVLMAAIWAVIVLITAIKLSQRISGETKPSPSGARSAAE
jgi:hypothetical protein